jgi:hypothetical protein
MLRIRCRAFQARIRHRKRSKRGYGIASVPSGSDVAGKTWPTHFKLVTGNAPVTSLKYAGFKGGVRIIFLGRFVCGCGVAP